MVFLCSAVFAAGCAGNAGEYVLTGKFENAAASYAMIKCGKTVEDMDTIRLSADGSFRYVRKLEKPAISFMMVPETGFFSVIMINGTRNHIEADLSRVGDCRITGDLADAHRLYAELQREMKEKTGQDYASFKEAELTFADFRLRAEKRLADIPDTTFRSLALRELDASAFLTLFTWLGRLQDAGLPVSSDPDYNRFMQECDVDNPGYMANGLIDYYFSWCCQCRQENGGKDAWQYTLSLVAGKIADLQIREKVYMNILTEFFAGEDADGEAEAVLPGDGPTGGRLKIRKLSGSSTGYSKNSAPVPMLWSVNWKILPERSLSFQTCKARRFIWTCGQPGAVPVVRKFLIWKK